MHGQTALSENRPPLQAARFAVLFLCCIAISSSAYGPGLPEAARPAVKSLLPLLWLLLAWMAGKNNWLAPYREAFLAFFAVSLGLWGAWLIGDWPLRQLGLTTDSLQGVAVAKAIEVLPVVAAILIVNQLEGEDLASLYLRRARLGRSLLYGVGLGAVLWLIFLAMGGRQVFAYAGASRLLAALPYLLLFALANGFMEELWYRGLYLGRFEPLIGSRNALALTTLAFVALHLAADYASGSLVQLLASTLLLGLVCGLIVLFTRCLWGAVLAHALGDILVLLGFFWTLL